MPPSFPRSYSAPVHFSFVLKPDELSSNTKMADPNIPTHEETIYYKLGPAGSQDSEQWDLKGRTEIIQIFIWYGEFIHSIQFQYLVNGRLLMSPIFGSSNFSGPGFKAIKLDYPSEYITGVVGYSSSCVEELTIYTNKGYHGSYGDGKYTEKKKFSFLFGPDNQFGGFHGSHDSNMLTGIGVYFMPVTTLVPTVIGNTQLWDDNSTAQPVENDDELNDDY